MSTPYVKNFASVYLKSLLNSMMFLNLCYRIFKFEKNVRLPHNGN